MRYKSFLIKYGEIGVKGKNRYLFEDALMKQIRIALTAVEGEFVVSKELGRIYVDADKDYDEDEVISALTKVFGIVAVCPMVRIEDKDFENLTEYLLKKNIAFSILQETPNKKNVFKNQTLDCSINSLDDEIKKLDNLLEIARKKQIILNKTTELKKIATSMGLPFDYFL